MGKCGSGWESKQPEEAAAIELNVGASFEQVTRCWLSDCYLRLADDRWLDLSSMVVIGCPTLLMTCNVAVALELRIAVGGVCVDAAVAPLLLCAHRLYLYQLLHTFVCPVIATSLNPLAGLTLLRAARAKAILTNPYEVPNSVQIVVVPTLLFVVALTAVLA